MDGNPMLELDKAKSQLLLLEPFFGYLLLKLKFIENNKISTLMTNGISFQYSPSFIKNTKPEHLIGDLVHELLHCVLKHPIRGKDHNIKISNYAADYVVNDYIRNKTDFLLQDWVLYDPRFSNMTYEEVYAILFKECNGKPDEGLVSKSEKQGTFVIQDKKTIVDPDTKITLDDYWTSNIQEAGNILKAIKKQPTKCEEEILKGNKPAQLPWERLLYRFMDAHNKLHTSWSRPNRRFIAQGLYLPTKSSGGMTRFVAAIDTSCSVTQIQFQHMIAEINKILLKIKPEEFILLHCDDRIAKAEIFNKSDYPITTVMMGRGYTEFSPVFDYIKSRNLNPNCLVYFTDLEGDFDFSFPKYPVLWINTSPTNKLVAPFGSTIRLKT